MLDLAVQVEGTVRHASVHAAGIVIAPTAMTDFAPLQRESKGDKRVIQYDFHAAEEIGLVKMDFLGIRNLSILGR
jgi:DNA polymerase-3 subunit alpha